MKFFEFIGVRPQEVKCVTLTFNKGDIHLFKTVQLMSVFVQFESALFI
jgi:hypothetical protein